MVPCCRLYGWLGVKLKQREEKAEGEGEEEEEKDEGAAGTGTSTPGTKRKENPFAAWIDTYSSCEYHDATVKLEALLDRLAEGLSAEERGEFFFSFFCSLFIFFCFCFFFPLRSNIASNDALAAWCRCFFSSHREQKQQQQQQQQPKRIPEKHRHAPGACSRRPRTERKRRRGTGIGVVAG